MTSFAADSDVLNNTATRQPLKGIDGIYVINLDRRPDRLQSFKERSGLVDADFHRFSAVDGKRLKWTPEINDLFRNNNFGWQAARIGCALSHYTLYQHIASTEDELHLVLEDDAQFIDNWMDVWNNDIYPDLPDDAYVLISLP